MSTLIIQNLIPSLRETVFLHLKAYLTGAGELSNIYESLEFWYDRIRDSLHPDLPQWQDVPSNEQDQLFDAWHAAMEDFWRERLTKSARQTSALPISVPVAAPSLFKEDAGSCPACGLSGAHFCVVGPDSRNPWQPLDDSMSILNAYLDHSPEWLNNAYLNDSCVHRTLKECASKGKAIQDVWPLLASRMYELKNTWEGTALDNARKNYCPVVMLSPASSPAAVPPVEPLGDVLKKDAATWERIYFDDADGDSSCLSACNDKAVFTGDQHGIAFPREKVPSLIAHLQSWLLTGSLDLKGLPSSPPSSEDTELLTEARDALEDLNYCNCDASSNQLHRPSCSKVWVPELISRINTALEASTTSQKGGRGA